MAISAVPLRAERTSGVERYAVELTNAIAAAGSSIVLFAYPWMRHQVSSAVTVVAPPAWLPRVVAQEFWLPLTLARYRIRTLQTILWGPPVLWRGKWIATVHDMVPFTHPETLSLGARLYFRPLFRLALSSRRLRGTSMPSASTYAEYSARCSTNRPFAITYEGVSRHMTGAATAPARHLTSPPDHVCRILLVGTVEPRKNLAAVARAAQYLLELDPSIEIVGFGRQGWGTPPEKPLRWRFDATDGDIAAALANSCVFLSGSKEEGFNIPALEAQNAGLPCVLSDIPVHRELFANGSLLMDFRQPEEVAISLHALLHDPASYESLSKAAVCAAAGYTWSNAAEKTLALWNQVR